MKRTMTEVGPRPTQVSGRLGLPLCVTLAVAALPLVGCADRSGAPSGLLVETDSIGDTLVVRTVAGSAWGGAALLVPEVSIGEMDGPLEYLLGSVTSVAVGADGTIYVVDGQVPELRAYDADGVFIRVLGPPGEGPGELGGPDGGLAVLADGRILVRDPGNARIQVYAPDGEALATWPIRGGFMTGTPFYKTATDDVHAPLLLDPSADVSEWRRGLVRIGPDGELGDTLIPPDPPYDRAIIEVRMDGGVARNSVPFTPRAAWVLHPDGYFVHGLSTSYRLTVLRPGAPVHIEREHTPVPVGRGERDEAEARATRQMRGMDPTWRWNGPPIPDVKPPFRDLFVGRDGRLWVMVHAPAVEVDDPAYDPTDPESIPNRWREPVAFDVFEVDGAYLGRVDAGLDFAIYPTPVFDATHVWAVTRDDLGVQRVVRFAIRLPDAS